MDRNNLQQIENTLKAAYNFRASYDVGDQWREKTMQRIRKIGPLTSQNHYLAGFEQFVWQLAPVTSFLIVVMGTLIVHFGWFPETQLVNLLINESQTAFSLFYKMGMG